jgi:hypothetical protein
MEMRRKIVTHQQNRIKEPIKPQIVQNNITLEQYFKGANFRVVEVKEEEFDEQD